jgi:phage shock protein E
MNFILKHKLAIFGILAGAIAGYVYYCTVGCVTGSCSITSDPTNSTLYGAAMGGLFMSLFQKESKKNDA